MNIVTLTDANAPATYQEQKAARRKRRQEREAAYAAALKRYSADRRTARERGEKMPDMADYMPVFAG